MKDLRRLCQDLDRQIAELKEKIRTTAPNGPETEAARRSIRARLRGIQKKLATAARRS